MTTAAELSAPVRLPAAARVALALEIVGAYVRARLALRRSGLRAALDSLRAAEQRGAPPANAVAVGRRLGRAVGRTLALLPSDTRCLAQSLTLTRMLAARGVESRLVIGVRPGERFAAHAWVEHGGVPLLPPGADSFVELVTL